MKYLIFGSAWYIKEWCSLNKIHFDDTTCFVCINNSIKLVSKFHLVHRWYVGTDFFINKFYKENSFNIHEYNNYYKHGYPSIISGDFLNNPYGYPLNLGGTMILNVCYDLLNKSIIRGDKCIVAIIGCDLIYNNEKTHFYGNGTDDPMRLGKHNLIEYLSDLKKSFLKTNNQIFNLSTETETLLPFAPINIKEFSDL